LRQETLVMIWFTYLLQYILFAPQRMGFFNLLSCLRCPPPVGVGLQSLEDMSCLVGQQGKTSILLWTKMIFAKKDMFADRDCIRDVRPRYHIRQSVCMGAHYGHAWPDDGL